MSKTRENVKELEKKVLNSDQNEFYQTIERIENFKIGTGVRMLQSESTFFTEVTIQLCREGCKVNIQRLEKKLMLMKSLKHIGYTLKCEDHSTICCEKEINKSDIEQELEFVRSRIDDIVNKEVKADE